MNDLVKWRRVVPLGRGNAAAGPRVSVAVRYDEEKPHLPPRADLRLNKELMQLLGWQAGEFVEVMECVDDGTARLLLTRTEGDGFRLIIEGGSGYLNVKSIVSEELPPLRCRSMRADHIIHREDGIALEIHLPDWPEVDQYEEARSAARDLSDDAVIRAKDKVPVPQSR